MFGQKLDEMEKSSVDIKNYQMKKLLSLWFVGRIFNLSYLSIKGEILIIIEFKHRLENFVPDLFLDNSSGEVIR